MSATVHMRVHETGTRQFNSILRTASSYSGVQKDATVQPWLHSGPTGPPATRISCAHGTPANSLGPAGPQGAPLFLCSLL